MNTFMLDFYMFVNLSFCFACIITFVAVIINTFMTWFHMLFKFIFPCRFLTALVTVITYIIMIWFNNLINLIKNLPNCISCSGYGEPAVKCEDYSANLCLMAESGAICSLLNFASVRSMGLDPEDLELSNVSITGVNGKKLQSQTRQMHVKIVN